MSQKAIKATGLKKAFGDHQVLNGVDLDLDAGKSLVVIGGSGTGKSVLLRCLLGLETPDQGAISIFGNSVSASVDRMSMLFQNGALFDSLSIWENIAFKGLFGRSKKRVNRADGRKLAIAKLKEVDLDSSVADLFPSELSGGMQKRAALARAVAFDPQLVFFDEPTTGLDPVRAAQINELIARLVRSLGASAITITHDMSSATTIADEVALLKDGQFVWQGGPQDLFTAEQVDLRAFVDPIIQQTKAA